MTVPAPDSREITKEFIYRFPTVWISLVFFLAGYLSISKSFDIPLFQSIGWLRFLPFIVMYVLSVINRRRKLRFLFTGVGFCIPDVFDSKKYWLVQYDQVVNVKIWANIISRGLRIDTVDRYFQLDFSAFEHRRFDEVVRHIMHGFEESVRRREAA